MKTFSLKAGSHQEFLVISWQAESTTPAVEGWAHCPSLQSWGRSLCSKQVPSTLPWFAQQPLFLPWVAEHGALLHSQFIPLHSPGCLLHSYIWHSLGFTLRAAQKQPRMMGTSPRADNMTAVELIYVHLRKDEQTIVGMLLNKSSSFWMYKTFCTSEPE